MRTWIFSMCGDCFALFRRRERAAFAFKLKGKFNKISPIPGKMYISEIVKGSLKVPSDSCLVVNGLYPFHGEINGTLNK